MKALFSCYILTCNICEKLTLFFLLGYLQVRAYFTIIVSHPCPPLTGLCTEGVNCTLHRAYSPFSSAKPGSGWCVRQWEQVVPSHYSSSVSLKYETSFKNNRLIKTASLSVLVIEFNVIYIFSS